MAEEENNEPKKRGGLVKILLFAFGGIALIGIGLGVGFVLLAILNLIHLRRLSKLSNAKWKKLMLKN